MFDSKSSDGTGALLFALLMLLIAAVSFTVAIICGGIYSTVSSLWNFANKKFTKGVLWAGPALLVGNAFLIHPAGVRHLRRRPGCPFVRGPAGDDCHVVAGLAWQGAMACEPRAYSARTRIVGRCSKLRLPNRSRNSRR